MMAPLRDGEEGRQLLTPLRYHQKGSVWIAGLSACNRTSRKQDWLVTDSGQILDGLCQWLVVHLS